MNIDIKNLVQKLNGDLLSVVKEVIVNAIQANAINIELIFYRDKSQQKLLNDKKNKIVGFDIIDNGDGFTEDNIKSFSTYGSILKIKQGCKGIGRLIFLKVFKNIRLESRLYPNQITQLEFTDKFTSSDFKKNNNVNVNENSTTVSFSNLIENKNSKNLLLTKIKDEVYEHILPLLYLNSDKKIKIKFIDDDDKSEEIINNSDLEKFNKEIFTITKKENSQIKETFTLHYCITQSETAKNICFYCANNRAVEEFKDKKLQLKALSDHRIIFLLQSKLFDDNVNNDRNDIQLPKGSLFITWNDINENVKTYISDILYKQIPRLKSENERTITEFKNEYPHLASYIKEINTVAGTIDYKKSILEETNKLYLKDKETLRKNINQRIYDKETLAITEIIASKTLTEYIYTREEILNIFEHSCKNEQSEKKIHTLLIPKGIEGNSIEQVPLEKNNIWIIDDRFMSYSYVASEKTIQTTCKNLNKFFEKEETSNKLRPDIFVFFDNKDGNNNAVVIELKSDNNSRNVFQGLEQLKDYAEEFYKQKKLKSIWCYLITNIDEDFAHRLIRDEYKPLFSTKEKIYFRYHEQMNLHLYVLSTDTLIADARARNKTFLDIIKNYTYPPRSS